MAVLSALWLLCASPRPALDAAFPSLFRRGEGSVQVSLTGSNASSVEVQWSDAGASVWIVASSGGRSGFGYQAASGWRQLAGKAAETELPCAGASPAERLAALGAKVPPAALAVLDEEAARRLLRHAETAIGWISASKGGLREWRGIGPNGPVFLQLGGQDRLLAWAGLEGAGTGARYEYRTGGAVELGPPSAVARPSNLPMPRFADDRARKLVERAVAKYATLRASRYVSEGRDRVEVIHEGVKFRYRSGARTVGFDGSALWVRDGGPVYSAAADPRTAAIWLDRLGIQLEPVLREMVRGRNPMRLVLPPEGIAAWAGTEGQGPQAVQLIECAAPGMRLVFGVRPDGLLDSIAVANVDAAGKVLNRSQRVYRYAAGAPSPRDFQPPAGVARKPLSELLRARSGR
ncbi:MAG: hypothetical protein ACK41F_07425 [Fimbriimonadaceae bacterium]